MTSGTQVILRVAVAALVLPTVAIFFRLWSKGIKEKGRYSIDDWLALLAWVSTIYLANLLLCFAEPCHNLLGIVSLFASHNFGQFLNLSVS